MRKITTIYILQTTNDVHKTHKCTLHGVQCTMYIDCSTGVRPMVFRIHHNETVLFHSALKLQIFYYERNNHNKFLVKKASMRNDIRTKFELTGSAKN